MSLRDSLDLIRAVKPEAGHAALQSEIQQARASSLGAAEKKAIAALAAWQEAEGDKTAQLGVARYAVWAYFVQREMIGFRRHHDVIRDLDIPAIVLNGMGAMHPPTMRRRR